MGKKYNTVATAAAYNHHLEPLFEVTAYEGIKPSRAKAIVRHNAALQVLEAEMRAERVSNHKPKTDKQGKRPVVSQDRERSQDVVLVEDNLQGWPRSYQVVDMSANWQMVGTCVRFTGQRLRLLRSGEVFLLEISWSRGSCSYGFGSESELRDQLGMLDWGNEDLAQQLLG